VRFKFLKALLVIKFEKVTFLLDSIRDSKTILVTKIAQNKEVKIPMIKVVAKPLIGPEPK
jgi:hypothetical protein